MSENMTSGSGHSPDRTRVAVLVLGMHRSGTSAIARVLSLLGCDLPESLLGAGPGNVMGHWESSAIWHFNDELLASGHSSWDDWLEFDPQWSCSAPYESFVQRGRDVLNDEFGSSPLFVMKDPRNCRLFPFWREVLEREQIRPVVVITLRHPGEVAQSLAARDQFDPAYVEQLWLRYLVEAELHTRGLPRVIASYDQLLDDWQVLAAQMEQVFGFSWPDRSTSAESVIADFLNHELRHHRLSENDPMPGWIGTLYRILSRWAQHGEDQTDHARLDDIRHELNRAAPNFAQLAAGTVNKARHIHMLETEARARKDEIATLANARDTLASTLDAIEQERSTMQQEFAQSQREADDRAAAAAAELQRERDANHALRAADAVRLEQIDELNTRLEKVENAQRLLSAEHQQTVQRNEALDSELRAFRHRAMGLQRSANTAAIELRQRVKKISALSTELEQQSKTAIMASAQSEWLSNVLLLVTAPPDGWAAMPLSWRQHQTYKLLHRKGLFDAKGYLKRHADVAEQHMDPLRHYILHGIAEGRSR